MTFVLKVFSSSRSCVWGSVKKHLFPSALHLCFLKNLCVCKYVTWVALLTWQPFWSDFHTCNPEYLVTRSSEGSWWGWNWWGTSTCQNYGWKFQGTKLLCMGVGVLYKIMEQELRVVNTWRCESGTLRVRGSSAPLSTYLALCTSSIWLVLSYIFSW